MYQIQVYYYYSGVEQDVSLFTEKSCEVNYYGENAVKYRLMDTPTDATTTR